MDVVAAFAAGAAMLSAIWAGSTSVLTFDKACNVQTLPERRHQMFCTRSDELRKNPIIGTVGCCAATASGHVAAPPRSVTNLRRTGNSP
jgi:hypothetical protein